MSLKGETELTYTLLFIQILDSRVAVREELLDTVLFSLSLQFIT